MIDRPDALAWERVCGEAARLGVAWARFKLALDDYAVIARSGETPFSPPAWERDYPGEKAGEDA